MQIAVIGWGSLVWDPRALALASDWHDDGPCLPIDFARISSGGRLTLVLVGGRAPVTTYWAVSSHDEIETARRDLKKREGDRRGTKIDIAIADRAEGAGEVAIVQRWLKQHGLDGAVWTGLESNFARKLGHPFSDEAALAYLSGLRGDEQREARDYIAKTPAQIRTPLRDLIEQRLGWTPETATTTVT